MKAIWKYVGELDQSNRMCGKGELTYKHPDFETNGKNGSSLGYYDYSGTFFSDKFHGVGKQMWPDFIYEGEYRNGRRHGRSTHYTNEGKVFNVTYENGKPLSPDRQVIKPIDAWYGEGEAIAKKAPPQDTMTL